MVGKRICILLFWQPRPGSQGENCAWSGENGDFAGLKLQESFNFNPHSISISHLHLHPIPDPIPNNHAGPTTTTHHADNCNDFIHHMQPPRQIVLSSPNRPLPVPHLSGFAATNGQVTCQKRRQVDSRCVLCCLAVALHLSVRHHPRPAHGTCILGNRRRLHVLSQHGPA